MMAIAEYRRFTVAEYERLHETGIISPHERTELIEGEIITMAAIGARHAAAVNILNETFVTTLAGRAITSVQNSIAMSEFSQPQPDLLLVEWQADFYKTEKPTVKNVILLVEVSDSSLGFDIKVKGPLYARYGVGEYWVVDLTNEQILTFHEPVDGVYQRQETYPTGSQVVVPGFAEVTVHVDGVV